MNTRRFCHATLLGPVSYRAACNRRRGAFGNDEPQWPASFYFKDGSTVCSRLPFGSPFSPFGCEDWSEFKPQYPTRDQRYSGPELAVLIVDFLPIALAARKSSAQRAQPERARHVCFKSATRTSRRSARRSPDAAWILLEQYFSVHGDSCCCTEGSYRACRMGDDQKQTQVEAFIRDRIDSVLISKPYSCSGTSARRLELSRKWRARFSFRLTLPGKSCTHSAVAACSRGGTAATIFICRRVRRP